MEEVAAKNGMTFEEGCKVRKLFTESYDFRTFSAFALENAVTKEIQEICTDPEITAILQSIEEDIFPSDEKLATLGSKNAHYENLVNDVKKSITSLNIQIEASKNTENRSQ